MESNGKAGIDHIARRARAAVAGVNELDGPDRTGQSDGREVEHAFRIDDLAVVQRETIALERAEDLLDAPAQAIQLHNLFGLRRAGDGVSGKQAPVQRGFTGRSIDLPRLHQSELDGFAGVGEPLDVGTGNANGSRTQFDLGDTSLVARSARRDPHVGCAQKLRPGKRFEQQSIVSQFAILGSAHDQVEPLGLACKQQVNIAFAIGHHGHAGVGQYACRGLAARKPARRLLGIDGAAATGRDALDRSRPDLRIDKTQHSFSLDIDGDHRMDKEAGCLAVACRSKASPLLVATGKIDLGGVLHRQNTPSRALLRRAGRQRLHDTIHGDVRRRKKPCTAFSPARVSPNLRSTSVPAVATRSISQSARSAIRISPNDIALPPPKPVGNP